MTTSATSTTPTTPTKVRAKRLQRALPFKMPCPACGKVQSLKSIFVENVHRPSREEIKACRDIYDAKRLTLGYTEDDRGTTRGCDIWVLGRRDGEWVTWSITCSTCNPPTEDEFSYYWISLDRMSDSDMALEWTQHLTEKGWMKGSVREGWFGVLNVLFGRRGC
jgi:phage terminase large subunit GpA-like protein